MYSVILHVFCEPSFVFLICLALIVEVLYLCVRLHAWVCGHAVYVRLLVRNTHGAFLYLSAVGDTCTAMDQWVQYPKAETALSNILPCVDEQTTNRTLYQSKDVILQLANVVNTAISSIANSNNNSSFYNQSGPLMPPLCSPYDSQLRSRQCEPYEVSFDNASMVCFKFLTDY